MKLVPTQDWMLLKVVERITPVTLLETAMQDDYAGFEVVAIGPWDFIPTGISGARDVSKFHYIKVGDIVVIEGLNAPKMEFEGQECYVARVRNVCFVVNKKGEDDGKQA